MSENIERSRMSLIESALIQGIKRINNTAYRGKIVDVDINYERSDSLGEQNIGRLIRNLNMDYLTYKEQLLVSTASHFVWGEKPTKGVKQIIDSVRAKDRSGMKLTKQESILLNTINSDTDYF